LFHAHGRTDRPAEANSRFTQFCDRVYNVWRVHYKQYILFYLSAINDLPIYH
jgi:hypothetical protein